MTGASRGWGVHDQHRSQRLYYYKEVFSSFLVHPHQRHVTKSDHVVSTRVPGCAQPHSQRRCRSRIRSWHFRANIKVMLVYECP
ncbi:hypothetical protein N665_0764s0006 [Sinapis alba]|nr:hypothetical protein N665_0764s0006 [Sinapis alba]